MLKILPEQMEAFSPLTDELLAERIVDHLRKEYSDTIVQLPSRVLILHEIADDELKAMVRVGLSRARGYGISHESPLAGFIAIMIDAAPNFDQHPALQPMLSDETVDANLRVPKLLDQFTEEVWRDVKTSYDPAVWTAA
jgi:hypothetical protein